VVRNLAIPFEVVVSRRSGVSHDCDSSRAVSARKVKRTLMMIHTRDVGGFVVWPVASEHERDQTVFCPTNYRARRFRCAEQVFNDLAAVFRVEDYANAV
jgi:hypothetical protein